MTATQTPSTGNPLPEPLTNAANALRGSADQLGEHLPTIVESVRDGAVEGARTIQSLPDQNQRLLAAFSLGLGLGLSIAGAPRLVVLATLAPAFIVAGVLTGRGSPRRSS